MGSATKERPAVALVESTLEAGYNKAAVNEHMVVVDDDDGTVSVYREFCDEGGGDGEQLSVHYNREWTAPISNFK